ncbi:FixH family protein [Cytobacillus sp. FJAT-54145]|uniref:FixH family protein n=1 Tax=Cytobacillus spartinae TaxID=3299023 RepID=A0ABW6KCH6_9BACI
MKKILMILLLVFLLGACSSQSDLNVEITKDLFYVKDKESKFEIKITDKGKPVEGLTIAANFSMTDMDHGSYDVSLTESEKGMYVGELAIPMAGKWEIVFTVEQDGKTIEKVIQYEVKKSDGVATINGQWITEEDLEFYSFINKLHIEISREKDKETYKGEALDDALAYWDAQEKLVQDKNQLLTQIIRLRSMALLGEEKGHKATESEIEEEITKVRNQYGEFEVATTLIKEYGEQKFWDKQAKQYELIVLSQKVQQDLIAKVKEENPDVNEQEIYYLAQKQYEELLVSQVNSLKIEFL